MSEYKVKQIMDGPPNEWKGPHGVVWYIEVMVEGHDKPLSVGKKDPNSLKVGDTIYGDIVPTDYINDKFTPSAPPQAHSQGSPQNYQSNSKNITLGLVWKTIAGIRGLPENDEEFAKFYEIVDSHYTELILMQEKANDE